MLTQQLENLLLKTMDFGNERTRCVVRGYLRESQQLFSSNAAYYNITIDCIYTLCLMYFWRREYFTKHGRLMVLDKDKDVVTWKEKGYQTVYGNVEIKLEEKRKRIYEWTLKILNRNTADSFYIAIGLQASDPPKASTDTIFTNDKRFSHYAFKSCNLKSRLGDPYFTYGESYNKGDVVKMQCVLPEGVVRFYVNGKDQGVAFYQMDFSQGKAYYLAVYGYDKGCAIQLVNFDVK